MVINIKPELQSLPAQMDWQQLMLTCVLLAKGMQEAVHCGLEKKFPRENEQKREGKRNSQRKSLIAAYFHHSLLPARALIDTNLQL